MMTCYSALDVRQRGLSNESKNVHVGSWEAEIFKKNQKFETLKALIVRNLVVKYAYAIVY
jgi:hypothetical protein